MPEVTQFDVDHIERNVNITNVHIQQCTRCAELETAIRDVINVMKAGSIYSTILPKLEALVGEHNSCSNCNRLTFSCKNGEI